MESYTKKTFSPHRYEIWTMQSGYHNLPTIEGTDQHEGASYRAENVVVHMAEPESAASWNPRTAYANAPTPHSADAPFISMELAGAYPLGAAGHPDISYIRKVTFDKASSRITISDSTNAGNVILNFITYDKPMPVVMAPSISRESAAAASLQSAPQAGNKAQILSIGEARIDYRGAELLCIETLPITDRRLQSAWDHDLYRIRLKMTEGTFVMNIQ